MPNWVTNRITITGPGVAELRKKALTKGKDEEYFDFNAFIEMPDELERTDSPLPLEEEYGLALLGYRGWCDARHQQRDYGFDLIKTSTREEMERLLQEHMKFSWSRFADCKTPEELEASIKKQHPEAAQHGQAALDRYERCGATDWNSWAIKNWGTKWNSDAYVEHRLQDQLWEFRFLTANKVPKPIFKMIQDEFPDLQFQAYYFEEMGGFAGVICSGQEDEHLTCYKQDPSDERYRGRWKELYRLALGKEPPIE